MVEIYNKVYLNHGYALVQYTYTYNRIVVADPAIQGGKGAYNNFFLLYFTILNLIYYLECI